MFFLEKSQTNLKVQENHNSNFYIKFAQKLKPMRYFPILLLAVILSFSCNETANKIADERTAELEKEAEEAFEKFGKEITAEDAVEASEVIAMLESEDSVYVKLNSNVSQVCKKKGCWMMVPLNDETEMRVSFKDYDFFVPLNCEGRNTIIEGWAYKDEVSVATLKHYAQDGEASQEEIDAITEPEIEYSFMADGVLMN